MSADDRDPIEIGNTRARKRPTDEPRIRRDDHFAHGDVGPGFIRPAADTIDHPAWRSISAQGCHRFFDRFVRTGHAEAVLGAKQAHWNVVELDPRRQASTQFG